MKLTIDNPVEIAPRKMTPARRARLIERDGKCVRPGCENTGPLEIDHIVPLELGGSDADWNLECLCVEHHRIKTRADIAAISKAKRNQLKHTGQAPPPTQKIKSRGFRRRWENA